MTAAEIIGQILGGVAVVLGFFAFQMRDAKKVLLVQMAAIVVFCAHYYLLQAYSGLALNAVGLFRNVAYYYRGRMPKKWGIATTAFFVAAMVTAGAFSWQDARSLLVILGIAINTVGMSFSDPQNIRKSILVSSPLVLIYDILVYSVGGAIFETTAIVSSVIGIIRTRRLNRKEQVSAENGQ
ncbi:MAG: YgjV family protein [Clostridia bacterium]|nr:YgjV family protein [Clostridia bacterium]